MGKGIKVDYENLNDKKIILLKKNFSYKIIDDIRLKNNDVKIDLDENIKEKFIDFLNLKDVLKKYSSYRIAFLTQNFSNENIENAIIAEKIGQEIDEGKNVIVEIDKNLNDHELNLFYMILEKINISESDGKFIIITSSIEIVDRLTDFFKMRNMDYYKITDVKIDEMEYFREYLEKKGFLVPVKLIEILSKISSGDFNKLDRILNVLEKEGFIKNHVYQGSLSEYEIKNIESIISEKYSGKVDLKVLDDQSLNFLLLLSLSIDPMDLEDIKNIFKMDENTLINIIDHYILSGIIIEKNSKYEIREENLKNFIRENFSRLKQRSVYQKMGEYFLSKGDLKHAGIYLYFSGDQRSRKILEDYFEDVIKNMVVDDIILIGKMLVNLNSDKLENILKMIDLMVSFQLIEESYEIIVKIYEKNRNNIGVIERYAAILNELGSYMESLKMIENVDLENLGDDDRLYIEYIKAKNLYSLTKYDEAKKILVGIKDLAKNNYSILSRIDRLIGNILFYKNELDKALDFYMESLKLDEVNNDVQDQISNMNNMAIVYSQKADLEKALELYLKALKIAEKYWLPLNIITLYDNLGIVYLTEIKVDVAMEYLEKGYRYSIFLKKYDKSVLPFIFLFDIYIKKGNPGKALEYVNEMMKYIDFIEVEEEKLQILILKALINKIIFNRNDEDIQKYSELLKKSEDPYYQTYGEISLITYEFYSLNFDESYEAFKNFIEKYNLFSDENYNNEYLDYMIQYLEFVIFYNFIKKRYIDDDFSEKINFTLKIKKIEKQPIYYIRLKILYLISQIKDKNNSEEFEILVENLKDMKYLYSIEKIMYGLYLLKFRNDDRILKEGINIMKDFIYGLNEPYLKMIKNIIS
ncbi:MAG: tetratricopeptide repeat protein [Thermoplasmata archaeon]